MSSSTTNNATHHATSPPTSPPAAKRVKTSSLDSAAMATAAETSTTGAAVSTLEQAPELLIKKLSDQAKLPTRGSTHAAGYDLYAARETTIPARGKALVDTDLSMAVPAGTCTSSTFCARCETGLLGSRKPVS